MTASMVRSRWWPLRWLDLGWMMGGLALILSGCETTSGNRAEDLAAPDPDGYVYIVGPGDSVNIFVWRNPELSQSVPVRPDGRISLQAVGHVEAAGLTPEELDDKLVRLYARELKDPAITTICFKA